MVKPKNPIGAFAKLCNKKKYRTLLYSLLTHEMTHASDFYWTPAVD